MMTVCDMSLCLTAPEASTWAEREVASILFRDRRVRKSLAKNLARLLVGCGRSFSDKCGHAGRQAAARLFNRQDFTEQVLLQGHIQQTLQRIRELPRVDSSQRPLILGLQDTSEIDLTTHVGMEGLGPLAGRNKRGLLMHDTLLVSPQGLPLGVPYCKIWARDPEQSGIKHERRHRTTDEKESYKWIEGLAGIEAAVPEDEPLIVVQDRESDVYDFLAAPRRRQTQLLVRSFQPRKVQVNGETGPTLFEFIAQVPVCAQHQVELPRQSASLGKEAQKGRTATVQLRYAMVQIKAPASATLFGKSVPYLTLWIVQAAEATSAPLTDAQADTLEATTDTTKSVRWTLLCTEPITSTEQAWQMVQYYKLRWLIERLHFVLKSGCGAEQIQFDDATTAKKALVMYAIVAWRLLWLMHQVRANPDAPASSLADGTSLLALKAITKRRVVTAADYLIAIGTLGGYTYYPKNPTPGIKAIWRGLRRLDDIVAAFSAGRDSR